MFLLLVSFTYSVQFSSVPCSCHLRLRSVVFDVICALSDPIRMRAIYRNTRKEKQLSEKRLTLALACFVLLLLVFGALGVAFPKSEVRCGRVVFRLFSVARAVNAPVT